MDTEHKINEWFDKATEAYDRGDYGAAHAAATIAQARVTYWTAQQAAVTLEASRRYLDVQSERDEQHLALARKFVGDKPQAEPASDSPAPTS